jgi:HK97 family phage portal protein
MVTELNLPFGIKVTRGAAAAVDDGFSSDLLKRLPVTPQASPAAARKAFSVNILRGSGQLVSAKSVGAPRYEADRAARVELKADDIGLALAAQVVVMSYRCVTVCANKTSEIRRKVVDKRTGEEIKDHPLIVALDESSRLSQSDIIADWVISLKIHGEAYFEKMRDVFLLPKGIKWLNPIATEPQIMGGRIAYYHYADQYGGGFARLQPYEVVFHKYRNPLDDMRGLSPTQAALESINASREVKRYTNSYYRNDSRLDGLISFKEPPGDDDYETLVETIQKQMKGASNRGKMLIPSSPVDYQQFQREPIPHQAELSREQKLDICSAYGVPGFLVGLDDARYDTSADQRKGFYEEVVFVDCSMIARVIDADLLPFFDPSGSTRFEFDIDGARKDLEDPSAKDLRLNNQLQYGGITWNEWRKGNKLPPKPNGDVLFVPAGSIQVPVDKLGELLPTPSYPPFGNPQVTPEQAAQLNEGIVPVTPPDNSTVSMSPAQVPAQPTAEKELSQWENSAVKHGRNKALRFVAYVIPSAVETWVRDQLGIVDFNDKKAVRTVFTEAIKRLEVPDDQTIRPLADRQVQVTDEDVAAALASLKTIGIEFDAVNSSI